MPDPYSVRITPKALADLEGNFNYISQDSPQNAAAMIERLLYAINGLNILPYRFGVPRVGPVRGQQVRSMPGRPYLVRYRVDEKRRAVFILRVRHGARRWP